MKGHRVVQSDTEWYKLIQSGTRQCSYYTLLSNFELNISDLSDELKHHILKTIHMKLNTIHKLFLNIHKIISNAYCKFTIRKWKRQLRKTIAKK